MPWSAFDGVAGAALLTATPSFFCLKWGRFGFDIALTYQSDAFHILDVFDSLR